MGRPKGIPAWNKGIHPSRETCLKMSLAKKGKPGIMLGKKHSDETKKIIGEKSRIAWSNLELRKRMSDIKKANPVNYWLGKKRSPPSAETKQKMRETHKRIGTKPPVRFGEANNKWRGGVSLNHPYKHYRNKEYLEWRSKVFERDNYTCQKCGVRGGILHPHHLKSYTHFKDLRYVLENGVTLCVSCHKLTHRKNKSEVKYF
jgi:hypothetical protein